MGFWDRFESECARIGKKPNPIGKEIGVSSGTITNWKNGTPPKLEALLKLADFFSVPVDYLLGRSDDRGVAHPIEDDDELASAALARGELDPATIAMIKRLVRHEIEKERG